MKKRKIENKKIIIVIIILFLIAGLLTAYQYKDILNKDNEEIKEENNNTDPYKEYRNANNFKLENANRYIVYKENNPSLDYETVVTYVNIGLDKEFYSYIAKANTSKGILLLMNKYLKLDNDYEPDDLEEISNEYFINGNSAVRNLRKEAKEAFEMLSKASIENETPVYGQSAYRPYSMQEKLYNNAVNQSGKKQADSDTARPGHSEHQTGLAIDVSSTKSGNMLSFDNTNSFTWMQENAYKYGFILRYTKGNENIHGFIYESWHYRYVGIKIATDMHNNYPNLTYDEYYYKFIDN